MLFEKNIQNYNQTELHMLNLKEQLILLSECIYTNPKVTKVKLLKINEKGNPSSRTSGDTVIIRVKKISQT